MDTRIRCSLAVAGAGVLLAGCGSAGSAALSHPQPPAPIVLSAYVAPHGVRLSPARLGAGPVLLTVANQSTRATTLLLTRAGARDVLARTAPINPDGATQLKVTLARGAYTVLAEPTATRPRHGERALRTTLRVGAARASAGSQLLLP